MTPAAGLSGLAFAVFLSGCETTQAKHPGVAEFAFDQHQVVIGCAERQTVLTGFLLAGATADLAVLSVDDSGDRRLRIYTIGDGTSVPTLDAAIRPEVSFVDVANIGGRDRLITYEPGRLSWFDPEAGRERPLVAVTCDFNPRPRGEILHVDVTRDVNDDDRDDLVVPDSDGFSVFVQTDDGAFADPVKIGRASEMERVYGADGYRYDPWVSGRVHEMDYNRDGRTDLVFWNEDHFVAYLQDERGQFASEAKTFTTDVAFDSDDLASLVAPHGIRRRHIDHQPTGDLTGRVLYSLTDMNGDGIADLVVFALGGGSLWNMHSTHEVHYGRPTADGGTRFEPDVGTAIKRDGIMFVMEQHDFDQDGQVDMMLTGLKPSVLKIVGILIDALLTGSMSMDLEFYQMAGGTYPWKRNATRRFRADVPGPAGGKTLYPPVLIGDVNGDRRLDLIVGNDGKELQVFAGVPGPEMFTRRPQEVSVVVPTDEEYTWLVDLNKDGRLDVLLHHPSTTEPHRVTLLIAR